jgi:hypothetical protein
MQIHAMRALLGAGEEDMNDYMLDTDPYTEGSDLSTQGKTDIPRENLYPEAAHAFRLWQFYLDRVNPIIKVIHVPTTQPLIVEAAANPESLPQETEALLFAIFALAVTSLSEDECKQLLNSKRTIAIERFTSGLQQAIYSSKFLVSYNLASLQALVLYMVRNPPPPLALLL